MGRLKETTKRVVSLALLTAIISALFPAEARADIKDKVIIHVGKPTVWSRGQAHYLLAKMHDRNQRLQPPDLDQNLLNPNVANAQRVQLIQRLFELEGQFNQRIGVQNSASLREQNFAVRRRDAAAAELAARENEQAQVSARLADARRQLAVLKARQKVRYGADGLLDTDDDPKPANPKDRDKNREQERLDNYEALMVEIAELESKVAEEEARKAVVDADLTRLEQAAASAVPTPALTDPELTTQAGSLPGFQLLTEYVKKAVENAPNPTLAASVALENFINMQQEVIAKQLTLLRDEVGPDERIIFLELPASVFTADDRADNYVAQVQWKVTCVNEEKSDKYYERRHRTLNDINLANELPESRAEQRKRAERGCVDDPADNFDTTPVTANDVRAIDIIPRQSALNVNDVQATSKRTNFFGVMKWLIGLGVKVNYQKQKELYENFLQQEVFAAGFGKGLNTFGWTFGPQPGTKRLAAGVRTTYAVLAVPRRARELTVEARGLAFHRERVPDYTDAFPTGDADYRNQAYAIHDDQYLTKEKFTIKLPGDLDEEFKVHSLYYTPAKKGDFVTVVVKGEGFSPQMGVKVEDRALDRVISLGDNLNSQAEREAGPFPDVRGWFEQVSSNEIVMTFTMGEKKKDFVGSPNITLISPERTSSLSFLKLWINEHRPRQMLRDLVLTDPMFTDGFTLDKKVHDLRTVKRDGKELYYEATLKGKGLRRRADIWINGEKLRLCRQSKWELLNQELALVAEGERVSEEAALEKLKDRLAKAHAARVCEDRGTCAKPKHSDEIARYFKATQLRFDDEIVAELMRDEALKRIDRESAQIDKEVAAEVAKASAAKKGGLSAEEAKQESERLREKRERQIFKEVDEKYETPTNRHELTNMCVIERTTEEYAVRFPIGTDLDKLHIKYRQPTVRGFESEEFVQEKPVEPPTPPRIVSYQPGRRYAVVDIRFASKLNPIPTIRNAADGGRLPIRAYNGQEVEVLNEGDGRWRAVFAVNYVRQGRALVERDSIPVTIQTGWKKTDACAGIPKDAQEACKKINEECGDEWEKKPACREATFKTLDIALPVRPQIAQIVNPRSGGASGFADEQPVVQLVGFNLQSVAKVFFGDSPAAIVSSDHNTLLVKVPKGGTVGKGEAIQVPVVLEKPDGSKYPSVVYYTYLGEPVPVVVVGRRPQQQQRRPRPARAAGATDTAPDEEPGDDDPDRDEP